jgi:hypothetical protein
LLAILDRPEVCDGEGLAGLLRPGNAGSNTAADHVTELELALAAPPEPVRPGAPDAPRILIRTDSAGATYQLAAACRRNRVGLRFGCEVTLAHLAVASAARDELCAGGREGRHPRRRLGAGGHRSAGSADLTGGHLLRLA